MCQFMSFGITLSKKDQISACGKTFLLNYQDPGISTVEISLNSLIDADSTIFQLNFRQISVQNFLLNIFQIRHGNISISSISCRSKEARINCSEKGQAELLVLQN